MQSHKKAIKRRTKNASKILQQENQVLVLQSKRQNYIFYQNF